MYKKDLAFNVCKEPRKIKNWLNENLFKELAAGVLKPNATLKGTTDRKREKKIAQSEVVHCAEIPADRSQCGFSCQKVCFCVSALLALIPSEDLSRVCCWNLIPALVQPEFSSAHVEATAQRSAVFDPPAALGYDVTCPYPVAAPRFISLCTPVCPLSSHLNTRLVSVLSTSIHRVNWESHKL